MTNGDVPAQQGRLETHSSLFLVVLGTSGPLKTRHHYQKTKKMSYNYNNKMNTTLSSCFLNASLAFRHHCVVYWFSQRVRFDILFAFSLHSLHSSIEQICVWHMSYSSCKPKERCD